MQATTQVKDDRTYIMGDAHDYMAHILYNRGVIFDDDFFESIYITGDNASVQYEHYTPDNDIDIDITFKVDLQSVQDYFDGLVYPHDFVERELDTIMHQNKLYVGDFIQDIMIEQSYINDDIKLLNDVLPKLQSNLVAARLAAELDILNMV